MYPILKTLLVIDQAGYPVAYATISIFTNTGKEIRSESTDDKGLAIIKLPNTDHYITISKSGYTKLKLHTMTKDDEVIELKRVKFNLSNRPKPR